MIIRWREFNSLCTSRTNSGFCFVSFHKILMHLSRNTKCVIKISSSSVSKFSSTYASVSGSHRCRGDVALFAWAIFARRLHWLKLCAYEIIMRKMIQKFSRVHGSFCINSSRPGICLFSRNALLFQLRICALSTSSTRYIINAEYIINPCAMVSYFRFQSPNDRSKPFNMISM